MSRRYCLRRECGFEHTDWMSDRATPYEAGRQFRAPTLDETGRYVDLMIRPKPGLISGIFSGEWDKWTRVRNELHTRAMAIYDRLIYCPRCKSFSDYETRLIGPIADMHLYLYTIALGQPWTASQEPLRLERKPIDVANMDKYDLIGNNDVEQLRTVIDKSSNLQFRTMAVTNLGTAGADRRSFSVTMAAIEVLKKTKTDASFEVRAYTCGALSSCAVWCGMYATEGERQIIRTTVMQLLQELMQDPHPFVREQAQAEYEIVASG